MTTHIEKNFDTGVIGDYYNSIIDSDGAASLSAVAALNSTARGLLGALDAGNSGFFLTDTTYTNPGTELRLRLRFSTVGITTVPATTPAANERIFRITLTSSVGGKEFYFELTWNNSTEFVVNFITKWDNQVSSTTQYSQTISDGEHCIEWKVIRESTSSSNDGESTVFIDGVQVDSDTAVQNNATYASIDRFQTTGAVGTNADGFVGDIYIDELLVDTDSDADLGCEAPATAGQLTLASMPKPIDITPNGDYLYIGVLNSLSKPIAIKFSTALDSDGEIVFSPNAGSNIGVQCSKADNNTVWVAGEFDSTNVVEKSIDGGSSFDAIDDGNIGAITGFIVGPVDETKILVCDENEDIYETIDGGSTWINTASSNGIMISMDRLKTNEKETIAGLNDTDGDVLFSPDSLASVGIILNKSNDVKGVIIG